MNIALISNITMEPFFTETINKTFNEKINLIYINYYDCCEDLVVCLQNCSIIIVIPNFSDLYSNIMEKSEIEEENVKKILQKELFYIKRICSSIQTVSSAPILWFGYEDYSFVETNVVGNIMLLNGLVDEINLNLSKNKEIIFIDFKRLIANIGIDEAFDFKNKYRWNSPYSSLLVQQICKEIYKQFLIYKGVTKKCIVLDCDGVLWGGNISEEGIDNIKISKTGEGREFYDFQRFLLFLYNHGIILTVCSKNDLCDVINVFKNHSGMVLREEFISCFMVNWQGKAENIKEISKILNISCEDIIFIDDSDSEIEYIEKKLPSVLAIKYNRNTIYRRLSCLNLKNQTDAETNSKRMLTYKTDILRRNLQLNSKSFNEYIKDLKIKIEIHPVTQTEYARISELSQRTNKCTNGARYTVGEIKEEIKKNSKFFSVYVSDIYTNLGLVGCFGIKDNILLLFSLSCRALGRMVEDKMISYIFKQFYIDAAVFYDTGKNNIIKELLSKRLALKMNL